MKQHIIITLLIAALAPAARSENAPATQMRDSATHQQLVQTYRQVALQDPMRNLQPATGADPTIINQPKDLVADSDILCFGGNATLVPKRAILNIPKNMAARLEFQSGSRVLSWMDFFTLNRGWITTVEVTRVQAEGNEALAEDISTRIGKSMNLVVATYMGGPISVLPLKVPEEEKVPTETANLK